MISGHRVIRSQERIVPRCPVNNNVSEKRYTTVFSIQIAPIVAIHSKSELYRGAR